NNQQFSEELRLAFKTDRIDGQAGLYYFGSVNNGHTQLFANFGTGIPDAFGGDFAARNTVDSAAAFGQLHFHVTEALTLIAGARGAALCGPATAGRVRAQSVDLDGPARPTERLTISAGRRLSSTECTACIPPCEPGQPADQGCVSGRLQAHRLAAANDRGFNS